MAKPGGDKHAIPTGVLSFGVLPGQGDYGYLATIQCTSRQGCIFFRDSSAFSVGIPQTRPVAVLCVPLRLFRRFLLRLAKQIFARRKTGGFIDWHNGYGALRSTSTATLAAADSIL